MKTSIFTKLVINPLASPKEFKISEIAASLFLSGFAKMPAYREIP